MSTTRFWRHDQLLLVLVLCGIVFLSLSPVSGDDSIPITPTNAAHLVQVKTFGRGIPQRVDGTAAGVAVTTSIGMWLYGSDLSVPPTLIGDGRVALSRDGKWAGAFDRQRGSVTLYDITTGKDYPLLSGISEVSAIAFNPNGNYLAANVTSMASTLVVMLWNVATPGQGTRITEPANEVWFSADNQFLLIGESDRIVFWDITAGKIQPGRTLKNTGTGQIAQASQSVSLVNSNYPSTTIMTIGGRKVSFKRSFGESADRTLIAVTVPESGYPMLLWDVPTNTSRGRLQGQTTAPLSVAFSTDDQWAATANWDGTLSLWSVASRRSQGVFRADGTPFVQAGFNYDMTQMFAMDIHGQLWMWALTHDDKTQQFSASTPKNIGGGYTSPLTDVAFSPDGTHLAASAAVSFHINDTPESHDLYVWHFPGGDEQPFSVGDHAKDATMVTFSPTGTWLAVTSEYTTRLWDVGTGHLRYVLPASMPFGQPAIFSAPDTLLVAPSNDFPYTGSVPTLGQWDITTGQFHPLQIANKGMITSLALSLDGRQLAVAQGAPAYGQTPTAELWDTVTGKHLTSLTGSKGEIVQVLFSPDGQSIVTNETFSNPVTTARDGALRLWTLSTGQSLILLTSGCWTGGGYSSLAFSPDSRLLAGAGDYNCAVALWDAQAGTPVTALGGTTGAAAVAFSPDGSALAAGMRDGTVRLWKIDEGK